MRAKARRRFPPSSAVLWRHVRRCGAARGAQGRLASRPRPASAARNSPHPHDGRLRLRQRRRRPDVRRRGPGRNEDQQGLPFVGQAGRLLDTLLAEIGLDARGRVRGELPQMPAAGQPRPAAPGDRRLPGLPVPPARADRAEGGLHARQLRHQAPARRHDRDHAAARARRARQVGPRLVRLYPLFHPAAALYTPSMLATLRADFERIPRRWPAGAGAARARPPSRARDPRSPSSCSCRRTTPARASWDSSST